MERRPAKRTEEYERRQAIWNEQKRASTERLTEQYRRPVKRVDAYGKPLTKGDVSSEDVKWTDVMLGITCALDVTGDPIFSDVLHCLNDYDLDQGRPKKSFTNAQSVVFGDNDLPYLENSKWLLDHEPRQYPTVRSAAKKWLLIISVTRTHSTAAHQYLRKKYSEWKLGELQPQPIAENLGNADTT